VIAGTSSGVGKTTVATGLMAALRRRGLTVGAAKVGPDFIDPGYHAVATGRPSRNLDAWMCGTETVAPLAARAADGADVLVVEGVMGLFDGAADPDGPSASTAEVATLLGAPVVLVVDASAMSGSVAALVHGFVAYDPGVAVGGVVLNRVGSDSHESMLREALAPLGVPMLGVLRRNPELAWRDRHLGLVPVAEHPAEVARSVDALGAVVERSCDLEAVMALARAAPPRSVASPPVATPRGRIRLAVAAGPAFSFSYPENLELLEQAGAEIVPFDPATDPALPPAVDALYAGGGFPEVFAERLAANRPLLDDVRRQVDGGLPTWAECGGLLWLARSLDGRPLAGAVPADARMSDRLTLGYRRARFRVDTPLGGAGTEVRGHEFHYSTLEPHGDALEWRGRTGSGRAGFAGPSLLASYVHLHLAADPGLAENLVRVAADRAGLSRGSPAAGRGTPPASGRDRAG